MNLAVLTLAIVKNIPKYFPHIEELWHLFNQLNKTNKTFFNLNYLNSCYLNLWRTMYPIASVFKKYQLNIFISIQ